MKKSLKKAANIVAMVIGVLGLLAFLALIVLVIITLVNHGASIPDEIRLDLLMLLISSGLAMVIGAIGIPKTKKIKTIG